MMVHEDDNCLNGSNMKYISESEMIRLLEQDKDDTAAAEPPTDNSQLFQMGEDQTFLKENLEVEFCAPANDTETPTSPANWVEKGNAANGVLGSEQSEPPSNVRVPLDMADTALCLPLSAQTEDNSEAANPELQSPGDSPVTEDAENLAEEASSGDVLQTKDSFTSPAESCLPPPPCRSSVEFLDEICTEASALHQIEQPDTRLAHEEKVGDPVTPAETSGLKWQAVPNNNTDTVSVNKQTEQSEKLEYVGDGSSSQGDIDDLVPLTAPDEGLQVSSFQEKTLMHKALQPAMDLLPSGVLDDQQGTRNYQSDKQTLTAASGSTEMSNKGLVTNNEDELDSSSTQKDLQRKVEANELQGNREAGTQSSQCTETSTSNRDLEASGDVSLAMVDNLGKSRPEDEVENVSLANRAISCMNPPAINLPICQDELQDSLEDSELMEEEPEDITAKLKARERPLGAGAECLKCGRRIRRSRKEMVWSSICFKCRLIAKRKERLSNQSDGSEFPVEGRVSGREQGPSAKFSDLHIKRERDHVEDISDMLTVHLDPATGSATKKMYKCPKCEEAFRIPALLAGHIKCHTLPQCLTCGCPIPLKYKTKRIPRRCQKCIQQLREGKGTAKENADHQSETSDNEDVPDVSSEDAAVKKGKRKRLGKVLDEEAMDSLLGKELAEKPDEDLSEELDVPVDEERSRVCPQCGKPFKCNRSLNLHLLSHTTAQCESCGCRLQKKRRAGRWSKKCRICKLQSKDQISRETEDAGALSGDKLSKRLKAKQAIVSQKRKMQSIIKQKKELKWKNMLLAVKKLMNKSRKRKETAAQNADPEKKSEESSEAEKSEASSINDNKTSIGKDMPKPELPLADAAEAGSSGIKFVPTKTAKQGRKCLYKEKNIIKVEEEEEEDSLLCTPDLAVPGSPAFIKEEEPWQCLECTQNMENLDALLAHQQSHIDALSFTCPQCPQVFSTEEFMNSHIPSHEKRPFHCPECDKTFTKRNHLGVHLRVHSGSRPFACPDCPRRFRQKATLLAHRYSHRNFELLLTKPHQCSTCHKSFKQKERLVVHERLHTGECPFSCKNCDKVFPSKARLYVHRKLHKLEKVAASSGEQVSCKEEEGSFHCQDCPKICSTKASLALHRRVHKLPPEQDTEARTFHCKDCDKDFASKATLSVHLKNHSAHKVDAEANSDLKQPFPCKDCDKVCSSKASLVLHRKVHQPLSAEQNLEIKVEDGMPGFICKDCDKVCATKASLVLHSKVHKSPSGREQTPDGAKVPSFRCKKCSLIFSTKSSFVLHKKTHTPVPRVQKNPKDVTKPRIFHCKLCHMVFSNKASLFVHRKEHRPSAGEENPKADGEPQIFSCKDCDKVYSAKSSLVFHSKVHKLTSAGEENPEIDVEGSFVCKDCEKVCSTKASYVLHRKVHRSSSSERNLNLKCDQEKSFLCKECGRTFTSKGRLSFHRFKKHGVSPKGDQTPADETTDDQPKKVSEDKLFSCSICGLRFTKLKMLVQHKAVHGDRTATPCSHCGKRFLYKKSLFNHMKICQGKTKGKKLALLKKATAKRKLPREESGSGAEEEMAQKKCKTEEKKKAVTVTPKLKAKNQLEKAKKPKKEKEKVRAKTEPKPKEKRPKADGDAEPEDEAKKSAPEKASDAKAEKTADPGLKEQSGKEKNVGKVKRVKKETPKEKKVGSTKKWRVMAAATVKKKKLQSVMLGGKKKLLVKKRRVPLKPKPGAKSGQSSKEN